MGAGWAQERDVNQPDVSAEVEAIKRPKAR
jgi:hypothetical protein